MVLHADPVAIKVSRDPATSLSHQRARTGLFDYLVRTRVDKAHHLMRCAQAQTREASVQSAKAMHDLSFDYKERLLRFRPDASSTPVPIPYRDLVWFPPSPGSDGADFPPPPPISCC